MSRQRNSYQSITHIVNANSKSQTPRSPTPRTIQISVKPQAKSRAIPRPTHLVPRRMQPRHRHRHRQRDPAELDAIYATRPTTLQMRVLAKARSKPVLRIRFTKTKASWLYGKNHSPTRSSKNVQLASSNHGETIYAQHAWASFRSITDVNPTT